MTRTRTTTTLRRLYVDDDDDDDKKISVAWDFEFAVRVLKRQRTTNPTDLGREWSQREETGRRQREVKRRRQ